MGRSMVDEIQKELGVKPEDFFREFARLCTLIPTQYIREIRSGRPIRQVLVSMLIAARLGQEFETEVRERLGLSGFDLEDFSIKFDQSEFSLFYLAMGDCKAYVDEVQLLSSESSEEIEMSCAAYLDDNPLDKSRVEEAMERLAEEEEEWPSPEYELECDDEHPEKVRGIRLNFTGEALEDLPNVEYASKLLRRVVRSAKRPPRT
jgi:hypothetical protein